MATINLTLDTFEEAVTSDGITFVDFWAEWCGPCKVMAPILKDVKQEVGDAVSILKVDVDKNPQAAAAYQVQGVPTLILFKQGKVLWRQSGVVQKSGLVGVINKFTV